MAKADNAVISKWVAAKGKWLNFSLVMCGAYLKDGEITFYHQFQGQGTDVNVLDKTYDKIVDLTGVITDFSKGKINKIETVARIASMIEDNL